MRTIGRRKAWLNAGLKEDCAVAQLVREYMPHLSFDESLISLHGNVRAMGELLGV